MWQQCHDCCCLCAQEHRFALLPIRFCNLCAHGLCRLQRCCGDASYIPAGHPTYCNWCPTHELCACGFFRLLMANNEVMLGRTCGINVMTATCVHKSIRDLQRSCAGASYITTEHATNPFFLKGPCVSSYRTRSCGSAQRPQALVHQVGGGRSSSRNFRSLAEIAPSLPGQRLSPKMTGLSGHFSR